MVSLARAWGMMAGSSIPLRIGASDQRVLGVHRYGPVLDSENTYLVLVLDRERRSRWRWWKEPWLRFERRAREGPLD